LPTRVELDAAVVITDELGIEVPNIRYKSRITTVARPAARA